MRDRGKAVEPCSFTNDISCKKHPNSYSVGICPYCLKDRLVNLVCSECGEQRLSSCSCSDASSVEIGSVGRVSFLIENEKEKEKTAADQVMFLRRSSSSCVQVKKTNGFWKIKRLFRKKKRNTDEDKSSSEIWVSDIMGVSRSRSLCSFRNDLDEGSSDCPFTSAKISDVTGGVFLDSADNNKQFGGRTSLDSTTYRGVFPDFNAMDDDSAFIHLNLHLSSDDGVNQRGGSLKRGTNVWKWIFNYPPARK